MRIRKSSKRGRRAYTKRMRPNIRRAQRILPVVSRGCLAPKTWTGRFRGRRVPPPKTPSTTQNLTIHTGGRPLASPRTPVTDCLLSPRAKASASLLKDGRTLSEDRRLAPRRSNSNPLPPSRDVAVRGKGRSRRSVNLRTRILS